jgi:hypothetical protein
LYQRIVIVEDYEVYFPRARNIPCIDRRKTMRINKSELNNNLHIKNTKKIQNYQSETMSSNSEVMDYFKVNSI